jgi:hypothetical protein
MEKPVRKGPLDQAATSQPLKPKVPRKPKARKAPVVRWSKLDTPLSLEETLARIEIREFVLRFAPIMSPSISKVCLEELANIAGAGRSDFEEDLLTGWVSEHCVKSLIVGLLSLLGEQEDDFISKVCVDP